MTPTATAPPRHQARPTGRRPAQRPPRRVSGPARPARGTRASAGGAVAAAPPLGLRLARAGGRIVDARFLDRLLRGRAWIALLALGLMGIVFIQVSMLRLNAGISRAITSAETLHRQNSTLRADISKLDSSERIGDAAKSFGMIQPAAGSVTYLDGRKANGAAAARGIHRPKEPTTTTATTTAPPAAATTATTATTPPATTTQAVTTPPPTTTQAQAATTPPATTTAPVQQTQTQTQAAAPAPTTTATTATGQGGQ
jgi:cell division protein FtsL